MLLEEYTQEYADELHKAELEAETKRADTAEKERDKETERADKEKDRADQEKDRADNAENQIRRNVITMLKDQMPDEMILRYTGISQEKLQEIKAMSST